MVALTQIFFFRALCLVYFCLYTIDLHNNDQAYHHVATSKILSITHSYYNSFPHIPTVSLRSDNDLHHPSINTTAKSKFNAQGHSSGHNNNTIVVI